MTAALRRAGTSLAVPNYRRYFAGQIVSVSGNWMQNVAEMWLIVQLTGSGAAVGFTAGLQFVPILLFGAWGGLIADRLPKRRVLMVTQALMALPALALWGLTRGGRGHAADRLRARPRARDRQRGRQPDAPELRHRAGRRRPRGQRRLAELGHRAERADHRPGDGRRGDRLRRRRRVLRDQRALLRRHARRPRGDGPRGAGRGAGGAARPRRAARGAAVRAARRRRLWIPLGDDGAGRHAVVQLPGPHAAARQPDLARDGGHLRAADGGDGGRIGGRGAGRRRARARLAADPRRRRDRLRRAGAARGRRAVAPAAGRSRWCRWAR